MFAKWDLQKKTLQDFKLLVKHGCDDIHVTDAHAVHVCTLCSHCVHYVGHCMYNDTFFIAMVTCQQESPARVPRPSSAKGSRRRHGPGTHPLRFIALSYCLLPAAFPVNHF